MENIITFVVFGVLSFCCVAYYLYNKKKLNQTPYFKTKKKLEDDLSSAILSKNWQKKQEINLHLLWLEILKINKANSLFFSEQEVNKILSNLTEEEVNLPNKWQLDGLDFFPFTQNIISGFWRTMRRNEYKLYKPESILPFPKNVIKKAIYFSFDYLNYENPCYNLPDKQKEANFLSLAKYSLTEYFVDTTNTELPKDGPENFEVGKKLRKQQPYKEADDLLNIDWRSESD